MISCSSILAPWAPATSWKVVLSFRRSYRWARLPTKEKIPCEPPSPPAAAGRRPRPMRIRNGSMPARISPHHDISFLGWVTTSTF